MSWARPIATVAVWFVLAVPLLARAEQSYENLIHEALQEYAAGNYVEARILFGRAHELKPGARTLRAFGFCDYELKHYVESVKHLQAALADKRNALTAEQRTDVETTLAKAQRFIGKLSLETQPADAAILLDGQVAHGRSWMLDAGDHVVAASAPGYRSTDLKLTISAGQETHSRLLLSRLELSPASVAAGAQPSATDEGGGSLQPAAARPADSDGLFTQWWFWTALGVVVAGATVGTLVAINQPEKAPSGTTGALLHAQ